MIRYGLDPTQATTIRAHGPGGPLTSAADGDGRTTPLALLAVLWLSGCTDPFWQPMHLDQTRREQALRVVKMAGKTMLEPCPARGGCGGGSGDCYHVDPALLGLETALGSATNCDPFGTDGNTTDDVCSGNSYYLTAAYYCPQGSFSCNIPADDGIAAQEVNMPTVESSDPAFGCK